MDIQQWARRMFAYRRRVCLLALVTVAPLLMVGASYWRAKPPYPDESERFGVGLAGPAETIREYDVEALAAGWYLNWGAALDPPHPSGMAFIQTVRVGDEGPCPAGEALAAIVRTNPGSLWQIGNEPDSPWQDDATPKQFAKAYHELYHLIKAEDPAAQVAFGGLVQATPLRMLYLEHIWQFYQDLYGEEMSVDFWTVHGFILNEDPSLNWGGGIPRGMGGYVHLAARYEIHDHDDMAIFAEQIVRFRQWMAAHGQRDKPLLVPEYGILIWSAIVDENGEDFSDDRVSAFMHATFDYFRTAADPDLGYPADGNRLVQAWSWYSLGDDVYYSGQRIGLGCGGDLFTGAYTKTMTPLGQAYAAYVQPLVGPAYTDLWPLRLEADLSEAVSGQTAAITLTAEVANYGRQPAEVVEVRFWAGGPGAGRIPIGQPQVIPYVPGRYEGMALTGVTWTTLVSGTHTIWVEVDPQDAISESDEENNRQSLQVSLESDLLPVSLRFAPSVPLLAGDVVTVASTALATNIGQVRIPEGTEVWFWVGEPGREELVARRTMGSLAAGETEEVMAYLLLDGAGPHMVTVEVDPTNVVIESNEENNRVSETILVATARFFLPVMVYGAVP